MVAGGDEAWTQMSGGLKHGYGLINAWPQGHLTSAFCADALAKEPAANANDAAPEEGQQGNMDLAERGPEGTTPAMRAVLLAALQKHLGQYSMEAPAEELQKLEQREQAE